MNGLLSSARLLVATHDFAERCQARGDSARAVESARDLERQAARMLRQAVRDLDRVSRRDSSLRGGGVLAQADGDCGA